MYVKRLNHLHQHDEEIVYPLPGLEGRRGLEDAGSTWDDPAREEVQSDKRRSKQRKRNKATKAGSTPFYFVLCVMTVVILISGGGALYLSIIHDNLEAHAATLGMLDVGWKSGIAAISGLLAGRNL
jgi:hypothetical protein